MRVPGFSQRVLLAVFCLKGLTCRFVPGLLVKRFCRNLTFKPGVAVEFFSTQGFYPSACVCARATS